MAGKKKKKIRVVVLFLWVLLLLLFAFGVYLFIHSDFFTIENVEVTGNVRVGKDAILHLGDIEIGSNLFMLDTRLTEKYIEIHQLIKDATIHRKIPSTIEIEIQEREPWAQLMVRDKCIIIDDTGIYMEDSPYISNDTELLLISLNDEYKEPLNFGQPICPEACKLIKAVYEALTPTFCKEEISEYYYNTKDNMLTLYTIAGTEIRFGNLDRLEMKIGYMKEIQKTEQENNSSGQGNLLYVDMRFEGLPTIRDI